ncbi:MAG: adenylate/guanylate cyclase domain-containing protein [Ilumatobacter fluminis]|uniref:adenylate/guanylate cyclase domain-containing protein n=1 Tax=Ilumatobacter fluminis TaxID=467091 RepID=UPI0032F03F62
MTRPRIIGNTSLATRLAMVALIVTLVSLAITAAVGLARGSELADEIADDRFVSVASSRGDALEAAATSYERSLVALASSPAAADAIVALGEAYLELNGQPVDPAATNDVTEYYLSDVVPALEDVRDSRVGAAFLVPDGDAAVYLQNAYSIPRAPGDDTGSTDDDDEPVVTIEPDLVTDAGDGSTYSEIHPTVHQVYGQIAAQSGFDDLFLIDARADTIVYSVRKRIDFGTSLDLGPHSGSALARLLDGFADADRPVGRFSDFSAYVPALEEPTTFVASPVFDGSTLVGYIAASLTVEPFDSILSGDGAWDGFGDSGDAYLVGTDATMRSTTRAFAESPSTYLAITSEPGPSQLTDAQRRRMSATGTTSLVQPVDRQLVLAATESGGITDVVDHLGRDVRLVYRPIDIPGPTWMVFAQVDSDELDRPIEDYARIMLFAVALFIVVVTFVAVRWSTRLMAPIRSIAERLRRVRAASETGERLEMSDLDDAEDGPTEYRELSDNVDQMLRRLGERRADIEAHAKERTSLLQQFLPASVARRSEESGGEVLDHVQHASVVVVHVDGLGDLVGDAPEDEVRNLLGDLVDEVDALAAQHGLERIKLIGSTYYAVCGVSRPYLDHAPRAVDFALDARALVAELTRDDLHTSVGVSAGPVSVGLAARSALVYDVWGETVTEAEGLARSASSDTVVVSDAVRSQLPSSFVTTGDAGGAVAVTARVAQSEVSS